MMSLGLPCALSADFFHAPTPTTGEEVSAAAPGARLSPLLLLRPRFYAAAATRRVAQAPALLPPAAAQSLSTKEEAAAATTRDKRERLKQRQLLLAAAAPAPAALFSLRLLLLLLVLLLSQQSNSAAPVLLLCAQAVPVSFSSAAACSEQLPSSSRSGSVRYGSKPARSCTRSIISSRSQAVCQGYCHTPAISSPLAAPPAAAMALSCCSLLQRSLQHVGPRLSVRLAHTGCAAADAAATAGGERGAALAEKTAPAAAAVSANSKQQLFAVQQRPTLVSFLLADSRSAGGRCCCGNNSATSSSSCCSVGKGVCDRRCSGGDAFSCCYSYSSRGFFSSSSSRGNNSSSKASSALLQGKGVQGLHARCSSNRSAAVPPPSGAVQTPYFSRPSSAVVAAAPLLQRPPAAAWFTLHSRNSSSSASLSGSGSSSSSLNGRATESLTSKDSAAAEPLGKRSRSDRYVTTSACEISPQAEEEEQQQAAESHRCISAEEGPAAAAGTVIARSPGMIDAAAEAAIGAAAASAAAATRAASFSTAANANGREGMKNFAEGVGGCLYVPSNPVHAAAAAESYGGVGGGGGPEEAAAAEAAHLQQHQLYEAAAHAPVSMHRLFNSVVKVYSDYTDPNYSLPWQMHRQGTSTGSGFVLRDRLIMTNAHCVSWNNRLQVRKHGSPNKHVARILAVGHECDLALITVDDEDFWRGDMAELEFGEVPSLQDAVVVLGYPRGGDNLCITSGVVSRVDVNPYAHSNTCLLCVQIDAAINPGNSGGPALKEGRVVGVAFQGFDNAQNIGYIVPTSVIQHFLEDVRRHRCYTGFPSAGILFQHLENKSMQTFLGMDHLKRADLPAGVEASGILVTMADELRPKQYLRMLEQRQKMNQQQQQQPQEEKEEHGAALQQQQKATEGKEGRGGSSSSSNAKREKGCSNSSSSSGGVTDAAAEGSSRPEKRKKEEMKAGENPSVSERRGEAAAATEKQSKEEELMTPEGMHVGLKKNDVILAIDGVDVANDGTVFFRDMERVNVSHTISSKFVGDTITATVLRKKKVLNVLVPLIHENALVPKHQWDMKARYLIYGGLVFCPLTLEYLKDEFGVKFNERAPSSLLQPLAEIFAKEEGEEPIVLSHILASDLTSGYMFRNCLLTHVNGTKVLNMRHLAKLLGLKVPPPIVDYPAPVCGTMLNKPEDTSSGEAAGHGAADAAATLSVASAPVTDAAAAALLRAAAADAAVAAQCTQLQQQKKKGGATEQTEDQQQSDKKENEFVIFLLEDKVQLVLERAKAESMQPYILKQHAISSPTSDVL